MKAVRSCTISSNRLWEGTKIKIFSYLIVAILAGLSYRVVQLEQLSIFFATVVYSIIFLREAQSILENLCDAGADLKWLLIWCFLQELFAKSCKLKIQNVALCIFHSFADPDFHSLSRDPGLQANG